MKEEAWSPSGEAQETIIYSLQWIYFDLNSGEIAEETEMIKKMTDFYPPQNVFTKAAKTDDTEVNNDRINNHISSDGH